MKIDRHQDILSNYKNSAVKIYDRICFAVPISMVQSLSALLPIEIDKEE